LERTLDGQRDYLFIAIAGIGTLECMNSQTIDGAGRFRKMLGITFQVLLNLQFVIICFISKWNFKF